MKGIEAGVFRTRQGWCAVGVRRGKIVIVVLPCTNRAVVRRRLREKTEAGSLTIERRSKSPLLRRAIQCITSFFEGKPIRSRPPLDLSQGTPFQQAVWQATLRIPRGEVATYRAVAVLVGRPRATRAVGNALASNPVPVFVPCHRVVASDGTLGGFMGGKDTRLKRRMLELERMSPP